uniref:Apolipoprotein C-I n=1 Tax=Mola mola TaxID=94237 RepID=A0A3Q4AWR1_MOLML
MKLYLAVAVLMLAFVAHTEAQEEETVGSTFTRFGDHVTDMTRGLAKTKVQDFGGAVLSFLGTYYEDRIEPVTSSYAEWASKVKNSVWEKIQAAISD